VGSKTTSCPSASCTSAHSTACFLLTLVTVSCRVPLPVHPSIPLLALNENRLVSPFFEIITHRKTNTPTELLLVPPWRGGHAYVHKHTFSISKIKRGTPQGSVLGPLLLVSLLLSSFHELAHFFFQAVRVNSAFWLKYNLAEKKEKKTTFESWSWFPDVYQTMYSSGWTISSICTKKLRKRRSIYAAWFDYLLCNQNVFIYKHHDNHMKINL